MKSKIFCFNRTIFLKNITRFWPLWALYLVFLFFSMPITLFLRTRISDTAATASPAAERLSSMLSCIESNLSPFIVFGFSILCAIAVFSYLYSSRNCNMIHALPVKRSELFLTNYISGLLFMIIPQIIIFLMSILVCIINNVTSVEYLLFWLLYTVGMSVFFYSCAVFCCMLTGNPVAAFAFYVLGNTIYMIMKALITTVISTMCYGMESFMSSSLLMESKDTFFSPIVYLHSKIDVNWTYDINYYDLAEISMHGGKIVACYLVPAIVLIVLAVVLYKKRQLECAGDIVSLKWMNPIFRWLAAFGAGTGLSLIFSQIFFADTRNYDWVLIVCSVVFSLVCFFLAEMLLRKRFRVFQKKRWLEWVVCACATLFILCAFNGDLFHLERRIPDLNKVDAALLSCDYEIAFTEHDDLEKLVDIHQTVLENKKSFTELSYNPHSMSTSMRISYYLKNGRTITRRYDIPVEEPDIFFADTAAGKIRKIQSDPETYLQYQVCVNYDEVVFQGGQFYYLDKETQIETPYTLNAEEATTLFHAIKADILEGNYPYGITNMVSNDESLYYNSFSLEGKIYGKKESIYDTMSGIDSSTYHESSMSYASPAPVMSDHETDVSEVYATFDLTDTCEHTIQALIDLGIIESEEELIYRKDFYLQ